MESVENKNIKQRAERKKTGIFLFLKKSSKIINIKQSRKYKIIMVNYINLLYYIIILLLYYNLKNLTFDKHG